jgi:hypothetical protein
MRSWASLCIGRGRVGDHYVVGRYLVEAPPPPTPSREGRGSGPLLSARRNQAAAAGSVIRRMVPVVLWPACSSTR